MRNQLWVPLSMLAGAAIVLLTHALLPWSLNAEEAAMWKPVYSQDAEGNSISGDKADLIEAVRAGKSVRIYWKADYVEHLTDTHFITILNGEVFVQPDSIRVQRPSRANAVPAIALGEEGQTWETIISTTGQFPYDLTWFVQN